MLLDIQFQDESSQGGKTGEPYGFLGNIRGITTSPLRILWQLHLSILSNGMVYPLSGSYIDRILGDGDYLDLFVWWLGKNHHWWWKMVIYYGRIHKKSQTKQTKNYNCSISKTQ